MAVRDRKLSADFWLHEFPGWDAPATTEEHVARLEQTVARVLQPTRSRYGVPVRIGSWTHWRSGEPRTGSHAHGGTVDYVVDDGLTFDAFEWASRYLVPSGYIGRLIYEPDRSATEGKPQGEHIHLAPVAAMLEHTGDPSIQVLVERAEGKYELYRTAAAGGLLVLALVAGFFFLAGPPRPATT